MASLEKTERISGVGLLGVPTFDFCVWALDTYGRGELLMELHGHLPKLLLNPAIAFLCMCAGLGLLYASHKQQLQRILTEPSQLVGVDKYRKQEKPGWLLPLVLVFAAAVIVAPLLAVAYSVAYKGTPPEPPHLFAHAICKTVDCFPPPPKPTIKTAPAVINSPTCPNGVCAGHDVNGPITVNPPVNPNQPVITYNCDGTEQRISEAGNVGGCFGNGCPTAKAYDAMRLLWDSALLELKQTGTTINASELLNKCTRQIESTPEWLTPYLFCSGAETHLGNVAKAKEMLSYYEAQKGSGYKTGSCSSVATNLRAKLP
jgi:hypothetical protein